MILDLENHKFQTTAGDVVTREMVDMRLLELVLTEELINHDLIILVDITGLLKE